MSGITVPVYDSGLILKGQPDPAEDEWDLRMIAEDDLDMIPGGIHCAADIASNGWMFAMEGLLGNTRFGW